MRESSQLVDGAQIADMLSARHFLFDSLFQYSVSNLTEYWKMLSMPYCPVFYAFRIFIHKARIFNYFFQFVGLYYPIRAPPYSICPYGLLSTKEDQYYV